jgi:purine-binding chemotaxis protein CheW
MDNAAADETEVYHYCTFRLGGRLFGFDIRSVREASPHTTLTPIPHAPPEVRGYVNLRGHIFLVLDLRRFLGMEPAAVTTDSRLLLFKPSVGESFGVLVDQIGDIITVGADQAEEWRPDENPAGELIAAIAKLAGELLVILRADRLLPGLAAKLGRAGPAGSPEPRG